MIPSNKEVDLNILGISAGFPVCNVVGRKSVLRIKQKDMDNRAYAECNLRFSEIETVMKRFCDEHPNLKYVSSVTCTSITIVHPSFGYSMGFYADETKVDDIYDIESVTQFFLRLNRYRGSLLGCRYDTEFLVLLRNPDLARAYIAGTYDLPKEPEEEEEIDHTNKTYSFDDLQCDV
jgi:hypothetical protein